MTETSGYFDHWESMDDAAGAMDLALNIHAALKFGNISAWVWWQGSEIGDINEYNLMDGENNPSKRYYVSKQFYRYIRPGAKRVDLTYPESGNVVGSAYYHSEMDSFTIVAINNTKDQVKLNLVGENLPGTFDSYTTTATKNTVLDNNVDFSDIILPPSSIVTLVNGDVFEHK
jgi:O-glycosyl hydrolase